MRIINLNAFIKCPKDKCKPMPMNCANCFRDILSKYWNDLSVDVRSEPLALGSEGFETEDSLGECFEMLAEGRVPVAVLLMEYMIENGLEEA